MPKSYARTERKKGGVFWEKKKMNAAKGRGKRRAGGGVGYRPVEKRHSGRKKKPRRCLRRETPS